MYKAISLYIEFWRLDVVLVDMCQDMQQLVFNRG